jgi:drug/metabolite transporter (DMT)-like permease
MHPGSPQFPLKPERNVDELARDRPTSTLETRPRPAYWLGVLYLALFASVLTFSLYYPVVRKIGPAKASYSSVLVPIIAMGFSTAFEDYHWTGLTIAGALLALGGMAAAMRKGRSGVAAPDAA